MYSIAFGARGSLSPRHICPGPPLATRAPSPYREKASLFLEPTLDPTERNPDVDAESLLAQGRLAEAETAYRRLAERQPRHLDWRVRLGELALLGNRPGEAIDWLAGAFNDGWRSRRHIEVLAQAYLLNGEPGSAALCYDRAGRAGLAGTLAAMAHLSIGRLESPTPPQTLGWLGGNDHPLIRAEVNGQSLNLLVDTAAGDLILDRDAAVRAGVPHGGQEQRQFAGGRPAAVTYGHLDRLRLGALTVQDLLVQILDLEANLAGYAPELPIHGVLGLSVLSRFTVSLDWRRRELRLGPRGASLDGTPFWVADGQFPLVRADAEARSGLWVVDTGMAGAAFAIAGGHGADTLGMGGGGAVQAREVRLGSLRVNGWEVADTRGMALGELPLTERFDFPVAGLLGSDFFRDGVLTLDFSGMILRIEAGGAPYASETPRTISH